MKKHFLLMLFPAVLLSAHISADGAVLRPGMTEHSISPEMRSAVVDFFIEAGAGR